MNPQTYALLYNSALGSVRQAGRDYDPSAIGKALAGLLPPGMQVSNAELVRIAQAAGRAAEMAGTMTDDPMRRPAVAEIPLDRTIPAGSQRFQYRVVVTWNGGPGNTGETLIIIRSDTQMSWEDAARQAIADVQTSRQESTSNPKRVQSSWSFSAILVSVGKGF